MSKRKHKLVHESELELDEVVDLLEDLLAGLRRGELELERHGGDEDEDGDERLTLSPGRTLAVELAAKQKGERESLTLELKWRRPRAPKPTLRISPVRDPEPIAASSSRKSAALRLRRREPSPVQPEASEAGEPTPTRDPETGGLRLDPEPECKHSAHLDAELLRTLPKQRLYEFAKAIDLDGRSQLPKVSLARSLSSHDLRPHLERDDLQTLAASVGIEDQDELEAPTLLDLILARSSSF